MDKISYALGLSMGHNFRQTGIDVLNVEDFAAGISAVYSNEKPAISYEEAMHGSLTVSDVQMGLFRIREQGDMESGLLVPVWFITGEYRCASHPEEVHLYDNLSPIAVINAINGSIIDVRNGY